MHAFVRQTDTFLIASLRWHHMQRGKKPTPKTTALFARVGDLQRYSLQKRRRDCRNGFYRIVQPFSWLDINHGECLARAGAFLSSCVLRSRHAGRWHRARLGVYITARCVTRYSFSRRPGCEVEWWLGTDLDRDNSVLRVKVADEKVGWCKIRDGNGPILTTLRSGICYHKSVCLSVICLL